MPSNDSKTPQKDEATVVEFTPSVEKQKERQKPKKKKNPVTITQIATYIIIGLLALVLIAGVALSAFGPKGGGGKLVFGSYDGKPIEFAQGNYFFRQYQQLAQQTRGSGDNANFQVWQGAYQQTVLHTALTQKANKVGYRVVDESVNQAILESGIYNKDGEFNPTLYQEATVENKNRVKRQIAEMLPLQTVMDDLSTLLTSESEIEYVLSMGDSSRSFEYTVLDSSLYPDELAKEYALSNPARFTLIDLSVITASSAEEAASLKEMITSGQKSFEEVAKEYSYDSYAQEGGKAGVSYLYELESKFGDPAEVNLLFSTHVGELSPPFAVLGGTAFYRVEKAPFLPNFDDTEVIDDVKSYISANEPEVTSTYLSQKGEEFKSDAQKEENFLDYVSSLGLQGMSVASTPLNVASSNYLMSFDYTDMWGYLKRLSSDKDVVKQLYSAPVGSIVGPFALKDGSVVVVKITKEEPMEEQLSETLHTIYPHIAQSQNQQDMIQSVFASDKFKDNFFATFFEHIMGLGK